MSANAALASRALMHEPAIIEQAAHVEGEQHRLVTRFDVAERRVERFAQRADDDDAYETRAARPAP
jgi:hypothetical protein